MTDVVPRQHDIWWNLLPGNRSHDE